MRCILILIGETRFNLKSLFVEYSVIRIITSTTSNIAAVL